MLAITQKSRTQSDQCVPNVLPCRIQYNGPTKVSRRFWAPATETDGSKTTYYRGRKLRGRAVKLPERYVGLVIQQTDQLVPLPPAPQSKLRSRYEQDEEEDEDHADADGEEDAEPVGVLDHVSSFDHFMVWGHDQTPGVDDVYVKGIEEWIAFAEAIHGTPTSTASTAPVEDDTAKKE